jgi:hypothetical protein
MQSYKEHPYMNIGKLKKITYWSQEFHSLLITL